MTKVKSLNGSGGRTCSCGSWIKHWGKESGSKAKTCAATDCKVDAKDGAHVEKVGSQDMRHYIVPLCHACNMRTDEFNVDGKLVSANVAETCGK